MIIRLLVSFALVILNGYLIFFIKPGFYFTHCTCSYKYFLDKPRIDCLRACENDPAIFGKRKIDNNKIYSRSEENALSTDLIQYTNIALGYTFNYPADKTLYKCVDIPCVGLDDFAFRIEPLEIKLPSDSTDFTELMNRDFYCDTGGTISNKDCKNTRIEAYENQNGILGYKLYRTINKSTWDKSQQKFQTTTEQDYAYLFNLNNDKYSSILFATETANVENLKILDSLVNSFNNDFE